MIFHICQWVLRKMGQYWVNTLRPRQEGRHFADDTFKRIFLNENVRVLIKVSLRFVPKGPINNNSPLVQIMAWRRSGDKPLSESMTVCLLTHICVTRPQWVNSSQGSSSPWTHHYRMAQTAQHWYIQPGNNTLFILQEVMLSLRGIFLSWTVTGHDWNCTHLMWQGLR